MINQVLANQIIDTCKSFKIGKTSMSLEDRRNEADYRDTYPNITSLYESRNKILTSIAERELINACINHPKCDNEKGGDESLNDHMGDGDSYQVYIVWR